MKQVSRLLGLLFLLLAAQQGAVVHELGHLGALHADARPNSARTADTRPNSTPRIADTTCALCPAFAYAVTPAFGHAFRIPFLGRARPMLSSASPFTAIDAPAPRARSRGPPRSG